jgi:hypothetical protein
VEVLPFNVTRIDLIHSIVSRLTSLHRSIGTADPRPHHRDQSLMRRIGERGRFT